MRESFPESALEAGAITLGGDAKTVWNEVRKKLKHPVSSQELARIARSVDEQSLQKPDSLKKLIRQVASTVNVPVSDSTVSELVKTIQSKKIGMSHVQSLLKKLGR